MLPYSYSLYPLIILFISVRSVVILVTCLHSFFLASLVQAFQLLDVDFLHCFSTISFYFHAILSFHVLAPGLVCFSFFLASTKLLRFFLIFNIGIYSYKFSCKHCFHCISCFGTLCFYFHSPLSIFLFPL